MKKLDNFSNCLNVLKGADFELANENEIYQMRRKAPAFRHGDIRRSPFYNFFLRYIVECYIMLLWNIKVITT